MSPSISEWFSALTGSRDSESLVPSNEPSSTGNASDAEQGANLATESDATSTKCKGTPCDPDPVLKTCKECGITGVDANEKTFKYREECLAKKIAEAANQEWKKWRAPGEARWERNPARFGDLVEYWLSITTPTNSALKSLRGQFGGVDWQIRWNAPVANPLKTEPNASVTGALERARKSHFDWTKGGVGDMAWSAAFVVTCVRAVEIDYGIADADWLLFRHESHYQYTLNAKPNPPNRYQTIPLTMKVEVGDIIVQDRNAKKLAHVLKLEDVNNKGRANTHGDIVVDVVGDRATAIGGNLEFEPDFDQSGSVRKREYPLLDGRLVVTEKDLFQQENDEGKLDDLRADYNQTTYNSEKVADDNNKKKKKKKKRTESAPYIIKLPIPEPRETAVPPSLHPQSTARIFALLRLKDDCPPDTEPKK